MSSQRPLRHMSDMEALIDYNLYLSDFGESQGIESTTTRWYIHFRDKYEKYIRPQLKEINDNHRILINYQHLVNDANILNQDSRTKVCHGPFDKFIIQKPGLVVAMISCAVASCYFRSGIGGRMNMRIKSDTNIYTQNSKPTLQTFRHYRKSMRFKINARIVNFDFVNSLKELKSHSIERFVVIRGTVIRIGLIKPLVVSMDYQCRRCSGTSNFEFLDGKIVPVVDCPSANNLRCKAKNPRPLTNTAKCIDFQKIRIQELSTDENTGGRVPRHVDVELTEDLVDSCVPGDVVTVGGIVRATKCETQTTNSNQTLYQLYLKANSVIGIGKSMNPDENDDDDNKLQDQNNKLGVVEFTEKDYSFINKLCNEKDAFRQVVNSICPSIYGHEIVKAGLLLAMVGGNTKTIGNSGLTANKSELIQAKKNDKKLNKKKQLNKGREKQFDIDGDAKMKMNIDTGLQIRGDIHMLIVGDPGLGKSQMLRAIARIAPRGVYVSGNTTSIAGLTVTMVRDGGDHALEAGALVMGDQGVCCIDEFDKMGNQHSALLEAMEQQSISIAKSGMVCTLSARTSVIAAANPLGGHYDISKTIQENIKMSGPLLSRFDLLFLLLDKSDQTHDSRLSRHVLGMLDQYRFGSNNNNTNCPRSPRRLRDMQQIGGFMDERRRKKNKKTLQEKLQISFKDFKNNHFEPIPEDLLRKYIVYARKFCHPKMTASAKKVLLNFYLTLRKNHQTIDSTPITTRQLESLIRLSEARAKIELRHIITEDDAEDVIEIMRASLYDMAVDEGGYVDFKRMKGCSMQKLILHFKNLLWDVCKKNNKNRFTSNELNDILRQNNFPIDKHGKILNLCNLNGTLLTKAGGLEYEFPAASDYSNV